MTRPGRYATRARRAASVAYLGAVAATVAAILTDAPDHTLYNLALAIVALGALLLAASVAEHRLNRPNRTGETRAYRHHDRNHDHQ